VKITIPLTLEVEYLQNMKDYKYLDIQGVYVIPKKHDSLLDRLLDKINDRICDVDVNELVYDRHFGNHK